MSRPEGRDLFLRLAAGADVIVANFTPRVLRDWGLEPETLLDINRRLVILMMTGFGLSGPKRDNPALAGTMESASGFSSFVRRTDEEPPGALGFNFGDMVSGVYGALAVLLALHRRDTTGTGQIIDFACAEAPIAFVANQVLDCSVSGVEPSCTTDYLHAGTHLLIEATGPAQGQAWVLAYLPPGGPTVSELVADDELRLRRPLTNAGPDLLTAAHSRDIAVQLLRQRGLVAVPLANAEDLWYDPSLRARHFFLLATRRSVATMPHSRALPVLLDGAPLSRAMYAVPLLGEHNWDVLGGSLGLTPESFALLEDDGIIGSRPTGKLPRTFQTPLALDQLEQLGLIEQRPGVRSRLIASFADEATGAGASA
jgi:crotonobetainyl-CoA:carnitine CoA-transferase CaiB-like acyl-CoA transferase